MDLSTFIVAPCPNTVYYIPNFITNREETNILNYVSNAPKPKWQQLSNRRLLNYGGVPHPNGMIAEEMPSWLKNYIDKVNNLGIFDTKNANHVLVNEYLPKQGIMPHLDGSLFYPTITTISCGSPIVLNFYESNDDSNPEFLETLQEPSDGSSGSSKLKQCEMDESSTSAAAATPSDSPETGSSSSKRAKTVQIDESSVKRKLACKLLVERRSLLILKDDMYHKYLHSIDEIAEDVIGDKILNLKYCGDNYSLGERVKREKRVSLTIRHVPKTSKMKLKLGA